MSDPISSTGVIDVGIGNVGSVLNMLKKIGAPAVRITEPDELASVNRILLPGVGAFDAAMTKLGASGFVPAIRTRVADGASLLGICLGMQLLLERSDEGEMPGLGLIPGENVRFDRSRFATQLKVPHMGWSEVDVARPNPLLQGGGDRFYFVHSFHALVADEYVLARCHYGYDFACAVARGRVMGVQFHPEKSHRYGMQLLSRFVSAF